MPFAHCRECDGRGARPGRLIRRFTRDCTRCKGTGRRLRFGRHVWNHLTALYRDH